MSFPLTPSLSGGYQQVPNPQPQTPVPSPVKLPLSLTLGTSRIPLTFGPSRDGEYHLFISSPPTNPNPLPSPESPDTEGSHCPPRRPLFMRCTDGRYYPQVYVPTARKPLKLYNKPYPSPHRNRGPPRFATPSHPLPPSHRNQLLATFDTTPPPLPRYLSPGIPMGVCLTSLAASACASRAIQPTSPFPEPPAKPLLKRSHSC